MASADRERSRGDVRDRGRRHDSRLRPQAADRGDRGPPGRRAGADRLLRAARRLAGVPRADRLGGDRPAAVRRPGAARWPRAGDAPVPGQRGAARQGGRVLEPRAPRRRDLPRRHRPRAHDRSRHGEERPVRPAHDVPAQVHGAQRVPADGVAARPLLPHLPGIRAGRGRGRPARPLAVRARPPLDQARHARRRRPGVRRRGRQLRVGPLAGRRVPVRQAIRPDASGQARQVAANRRV